jgi:hypothetical protein
MIKLLRKRISDFLKSRKYYEIKDKVYVLREFIAENPDCDIVSTSEALDEICKLNSETGLYIVSFEPEEQKKIIRCFTSGIIDSIFYQTVYLENDGKYKPYVVTSKGEIKFVENNEENLKEKLDRKDWRTIQEEDRYFYFDYGDSRYKYYHELGFKDTFPIFTVNDDIISLIKDENLPSKKEVYDYTKQIIMDYWDHSNSYEYDVSTVFALMSYILRALGKTFYFILQGKEDTGKSTWQKVIARLQLNGKFSGKTTIASSVRQIHYLSINVNQDEFDKLSKEDKNVFIGVLNTGLYADGTYELCDMNKRNFIDQNTILFTFGEKSFSTNNLYGFDTTFLSRCYICICIRQGRKLKDINDISPEENQRFQIQRNDNFVYCLFNWDQIKKDIHDVKEELEKEGLFGRYTDMNSIILGIVKHFKGDYYLEVKKHLEEKLGLAQEERTETKDSIILEFLVNKFKEEEEGEKIIELENKEIFDYLLKQLGIPEDAENKPKPQSIGWILKNYNLLPRKENLSRTSGSGRRKYIISKSTLIDVLKRFGYNKLHLDLTSLSSQSSHPSQICEESEESEDSEVRLRSDYSNKLKQLYRTFEGNMIPKSELQDFPKEVIIKLLNDGTLFQPDKDHFQIMRPEDFGGSNDND